MTESSEAATWTTAAGLPYVAKSRNLLGFLGIVFWGTITIAFLYDQHATGHHSNSRDTVLIAFMLVLLTYSTLQFVFRRTTFEDSRIVYINTFGQMSVHPYSEVLRFLPFNGKTKIYFADGTAIDLFKGEHDQSHVIRILAEKCPQLHGSRPR